MMDGADSFTESHVWSSQCPFQSVIITKKCKMRVKVFKNIRSTGKTIKWSFMG